MTRMSKEISLVLLGTALIAGAGVALADDGEKHIEQANGETTRHVTGRPMFMYLPFSSTRFSTAPHASAAVTRGGFGSFSARFGGS